MLASDSSFLHIGQMTLSIRCSPWGATGLRFDQSLPSNLGSLVSPEMQNGLSDRRGLVATVAETKWPIRFAFSRYLAFGEEPIFIR